ncbi:DUF819 family protein [Kordiimonas pumila]|uniref:DUF819 domain-containing protein n=1 Tax=Kordiimonas pumila TaxID=2161677 RepID=A0ABV7D574_9PROT|nr:DUF819 family protein [Kordiimonas pumila]
MSDHALIAQDADFMLLGALCLIAAAGFWIEKTRVGRNISGAASILLFSMALSNLGVLPKSAPVYNVVWAYLVPLAIPLLLLKADLRRIVEETKGMGVAFLIGAVGTIVGAVIGYALLPLGPDGPKLAGVFTATYIGGSMNMAAVIQSLQLQPSLAVASIAADNVAGVLYLSFLAAVPSIMVFQKLFGVSAIVEKRPSSGMPVDGTEMGGVVLNLQHIAFALGLALVICFFSNVTANWFGLGNFTIMFSTAFTIAVANFFPKQLKALKGDYEIGLLFMYLFFAAIGISADITALVDKAFVVLMYAACILICHAGMIFVGSRLLKIPLMEVVIASNACAAGPASAAALAAGKGRSDLVAPAVLLGVCGYAIANFIGVTLFAALG